MANMSGEFAALRARVDASRTRPAPAAAPVVDLAAAVRAELERIEEEKAETARRAEAARWEGGPCSHCGWAGRSGEFVDGQLVPRWFGDDEDRPLCGWCLDEIVSGRSDVQQRLLVIAGDGQLRTGLVPREVTQWHTEETLLERAGFRWFHETPGARPSDRAHFAYVDREALAQRLAPKTPLVRDVDPGRKLLARELTLEKDITRPGWTPQEVIREVWQ